MKEPYMKLIAEHHGPESCAGGCEFAREALTGRSAGQTLSSEITLPGSRPRACVREGNTVKELGSNLNITVKQEVLKESKERRNGAAVENRI
jgi:hypothetical protein